MPDGVNFQPPPPGPPTTLWPARNRTELIVDTWRVMLADPDGNLIGFAGNPPAAFVYADRSQTRDL